MMIWLNWMGSIFPAIRFNTSPAQILDTIMLWIERTQQRRAIARLDDHLLSDIGLNRSDATHESDKPFWRQ